MSYLSGVEKAILVLTVLFRVLSLKRFTAGFFVVPFTCIQAIELKKKMTGDKFCFISIWYLLGWGEKKIQGICP